MEFAKTHRPNYVTEGPNPDAMWTRVKCDGDVCDFFIRERSWYAALDAHSNHVAEELAARDAVVERRAARKALLGAAGAQLQMVATYRDQSTPGLQARRAFAHWLEDEADEHYPEENA